MRWIVPAGLVAALLAVAVYFGSAYLTLYQLDEAVRTQDEVALDELVDWDMLGYRLEQDLREVFSSNPEDFESDGDVTNVLLGLMADLLINPIVDFYASPEGLAYLLNAQIVLESPEDILDEDFLSEDTWYDHVSAAYPAGVMSFSAVVVYPDDDVKRPSGGEPIVLHLRFQDFRWQLVHVELPLDRLGSDIDEDV